MKSTVSAHQLYKPQKEYYDKYQIKVSLKYTKIEYMKKISFIARTNIQIASPKRYVKELCNELNLHKGQI